MRKEILLIFCIFNPVISADLTKVTQFVDATDQMLAHQLSSDLQGKPLVHLKTLAIQQDCFSCGYHALFNALAFDLAVKDYYDFERWLRNNLSSQDLFFKVVGAVKNHVKENKPLNCQDIQAIARDLHLGDRLICLFFDEKGDMMIPNVYVEVAHPVNTSPDEIKKLLDQKRKEMVQEKIVQQFRLVKSKQIPVAHFICNTGNHWILFSALCNSHGQLKIYCIGAWNEPFNDAMKKYAGYFLNVIEGL
jgi:hypothetical protein